MAPGGLGGAVRDALRLGSISEEPVLVLMDIPDAGSFYVSDVKEITVDSILAFMKNPGTKQKLQAR